MTVTTTLTGVITSRPGLIEGLSEEVRVRLNFSEGIFSVGVHWVGLRSLLHLQTPGTASEVGKRF